MYITIGHVDRLDVGMKEREGSKITLRFLAQATGRTKPPLRKMRNYESGRCMGEDQELSLRHFKFEMPTRHPSGDEQAIGYMSRELRGVVQVWI